jgi:hypothetical protein
MSIPNVAGGLDEPSHARERARGDQPQRVHARAQDQRHRAQREQIPTPSVIDRARQHPPAREHEANRDRCQPAADGVAECGLGLACGEAPNEECEGAGRPEQGEDSDGRASHPATSQPMRGMYMALGPGATCASA